MRSRLLVIAAALSAVSAQVCDSTCSDEDKCLNCAGYCATMGKTVEQCAGCWFTAGWGSCCVAHCADCWEIPAATCNTEGGAPASDTGLCDATESCCDEAKPLVGLGLDEQTESTTCGQWVGAWGLAGCDADAIKKSSECDAACKADPSGEQGILATRCKFSCGLCSTDAPTTRAPTKEGETFSPTEAPPTAAPTLTRGASCDRLKQEEGLDCKTCAEALPEDDTNCFVTAEEDYAVEEKKLFTSKKKQKNPKKLWKSTTPLFKHDWVWGINLDMSATDWEFLLDKPSNEEWVTGNVTFAGLGNWSNVGIRFKGYYGSLRICVMPRNSGGLPCKKLSYKLKFNHVDKEQRFFGLKKLQLHASLHDPSYMRERLTYSTFREMGIPAPRQTYCNLHVNSQYLMGLHILTEVYDGRFTETYFAGGNGNLYKEAWPELSEEKPVDQHFVAALQTNEEAKSVGRLVEFGEALDAAHDDFEATKVVRSFMHAKDLAKYWVVDRAFLMWDGPGNFRVQEDKGDGKGSWNHNYFLHEDDPKQFNDTEFMLLPWDSDNAIPDETSRGVPTWDHPVCKQGWDDSKCTKCVPQGDDELPPSCSKIIRVLGRGLRNYTVDAALELLGGPLQSCHIESKVYRWLELIEPFISNEKKLGMWPPGGYGGGTVEAEAEDALKWLKTHREVLAESISCKRDYDFDAWDEEITSIPINPMLNIVSTGIEYMTTSAPFTPVTRPDAWNDALNAAENSALITLIKAEFAEIHAAEGAAEVAADQNEIRSFSAARGTAMLTHAVLLLPLLLGASYLLY